MRSLVAIAVALLGPGVAAGQTATPPAAEPDAAAVTSAQLERGKYLVMIGDCHNCHSPKRGTEGAAEPDPARLLSGHPAGDPIAGAPALADGWFAVRTGATAFSGPWGVSFARNLTPDQATGLGSWTEEMFLNTLRRGKHQGEGRDLLPPMRNHGIRRATDEDIRAVWAYLRSLPAVENAVSDPLPPPAKP